jgi:serine/threonine protein kinase/tetratricopeptide (TPR) repeat protein
MESASVNETETIGNSEGGIRIAGANADLVPGQLLGRYVLAERLGAGGMGAVHAAHDPGLGRRVAIKVVHAAASRPGSVDRIRAQLLREGQALARLSHPNVVPVYDVGPFGDGVFVAMELVDGETLDDWAKRRARHWTEVVSMFIHAARGLYAAHEVGLVHRDFKPSNVMIGRDGRIRVMDFGLAEAAGDGAATSPGRGVVSVDPSATDERHYRPEGGVVMGTPAFMSPEQHCGREVDDRSDQFSFCVALFRCLFGCAPFQPEEGESLVDAIVAQRIADPAAKRDSPRRLRQAIRRGLQLRPEDRWPNLAVLIEELQRCMQPRRGRRVLLGLTGLSMLAGGVAVAGGTAEDDVCSDPGGPLAQVYDLDRRARLASAFESSPSPVAPEAWTRVSEQLDEYATQWSDAMQRTCQAKADGTLPPQQLDSRMTCLRDGLGELRAFVTVHDGSGPVGTEQLGQSVKAVMKLPRPSDCEASDLSSDPWRPPSVPPADVIRVRAIRNDIRLSRALAFSGRYEESRDVATRALRDARELGNGPVTAEAWYRLGNADLEAGEYEDSAEELQRAYWLAREHDHALITSMAASDLIYVLGYHLARPEETDIWIRHAEAAIQRWGEGGVEEAMFLSNYGSVLEGIDVAAARKKYERSLQIYIDETGPVSTDIAMLHSNLAAVLDEQGEFDLARHHYGEALRMWETLLGPHHPDFAMGLLGLGVVQARQGESAEAMETLNRAEKVFTDALGPDHVHVAMVLISRSNVERRLGQVDTSIASLRRARQIYLDRVGDTHPFVAAVSTNLGQTLSQLGRHEEALAEYREAIRVNRQTRGDDHPHMAGTLANMGSTLLAMGRPEEALDHYERSLAMFEKTLGADHPDLHYALVGIGHCRRALSQPEAAVEPLRRAVRLLEGKGGDPRFTVDAQLALAQALLELNPPRTDEAVGLCRRAIREVGDDPTLEASRAAAMALLTEAGV